MYQRSNDTRNHIWVVGILVTLTVGTLRVVDKVVVVSEVIVVAIVV